MKISPVVGTPTIPQHPSTGLSPEKLQRLKSIAAGKEPHEEKVSIEEKVPASTASIKMHTLKTPEQLDASPEKPGDGGIPINENTQENAISDTVVQAKPEPEAIQPVSPQIAALAKQKRALQVKERELAEKEKALEASGSRADLLQKVKSGQALSVLQELGITYDQLTNELLGKQSAPDLSQLKEEILKSVDERLTGKDAAQEQAVFEHMKKNIEKLSAADEFPFVKAWKAQDKVMELIKRTWQESGEVLDEEEALGMIEAELKEESKVFAPLLKGPEQTTPAAGEMPQKAPQGIKTLTNKDSARPGSSRRQRALAAFLGQK